VQARLGRAAAPRELERGHFVPPVGAVAVRGRAAARAAAGGRAAMAPRAAPGVAAVVVGAVGAAGVPARIVGVARPQSIGRGARVATLPHAGAPDGSDRGRATAAIARPARPTEATEAILDAPVGPAVAGVGATGAVGLGDAHGSGCAGFAAAGLAARAMTANSFVICFFFIVGRTGFPAEC